MYSFYGLILPVIGAEYMCCENILYSKFHSFSWNDPSCILIFAFAYYDNYCNPL